jgi:hypothetical protein
LLLLLLPAMMGPVVPSIVVVFEEAGMGRVGV